MIELENLGAFITGINEYVAEAEELAEAVYRGLVINAFKFVVEGTPEWTGELTSQWKLTVGAPAQGYTESGFKKSGWARLRAPGGAVPEPYNRRFSPNFAAIEYAKDIARESVPLIRLSAPTFISNNSPYAAVVEAGGGKYKIRVVNTPILMTDAAEAHFGGLGALSEAKVLEYAGATL